MKKLKATVTQKDGSKKEIYVMVDDGTAEVLAQVDDKEFVNQYLIDEYKAFMADYREKRNTLSLEKAFEKGIEVEDESQNLLENLISKMDQEKINEAINKLKPQQQWIVEQVFIIGKSQTVVAKELSIGKSAMSQRMKVIKETLKKLLK